MLNYEKTLVVVAYRFNIEHLLQLNTEAPIFVQVRPVALTSAIVAPVALPGAVFVVRVRHFRPIYVHNSNIKLDNYY